MTGMAPRIWGPMLWDLLHAIARMVDVRAGQRNRNNFMTFLTTLQFVLPCVACRNNYARHITTYLKRDVGLGEMSELVIDLHNTVNRHLEKPVVDTKVALKRQEVWDIKVDGDKCIGFLYVVLLNYDACGVDDKIIRYNDFFVALSKLLIGLKGFCTENSKASVESLGEAIREYSGVYDHSSAALVRHFYKTTVTRWRKTTKRKLPSQRQMTTKYNLCKAQ